MIGVTGPPGAGKSTLLSALLHLWRGAAHEVGAHERTVAVLAVDPSSRHSGGSLLGDRARIQFDPGDDGVLIRSTAAGERLGGLARATRTAADALAAAFDIVVIETVGVGQAETDVADVADTVVVVVQPGGGDALQFLKSGIMEIPDVLVVTKADLGQIAMRTRRELSAALRSLGSSRRARARRLRAASAERHRGAGGSARRAPRRAGHRRAAAALTPSGSPERLRPRARRAGTARPRWPPRRGGAAGRTGPGHGRGGARGGARAREMG